MSADSTYRGMTDHDLLVHIATKQEAYEKDSDELRVELAAQDIKLDKAHARISQQRNINTTLSVLSGAIAGFFGGLFKGS